MLNHYWLAGKINRTAIQIQLSYSILYISSCLSSSLQKANRTHLELLRSRSLLTKEHVEIKWLDFTSFYRLSDSEISFYSPQLFIQPDGDYSKDVITSPKTWHTGPTTQKSEIPVVSFVHPNPLKTQSLSY